MPAHNDKDVTSARVEIKVRAAQDGIYPNVAVEKLKLAEGMKAFQTVKSPYVRVGID
jgi:hypothetical protein